MRMTRHASCLFVLAVGVFAARPAAAHPGIGIVIDSQRNVFYTDLKQVWRLAPGGSKSIAVPTVHTHELYLDAADNLYGEHLWYEGDATRRWGHRVWKRAPDGRITDVIPARTGFRDDYDYYSFVRDAASAEYWVNRRSHQVTRRAQGGAAAAMSTARFAQAGWMTVSRDGRVFVIDGRDLHEVAPDGRSRLLARAIGERSLLQFFVGDRHLVMGLWTSSAGDVFAAVYGSRTVKRITPGGRMTVFARSPAPWSPTGGICGPDGDTWLLEYSATGAARVRRIGRDGSSRVY